MISRTLCLRAVGLIVGLVMIGCGATPQRSLVTLTPEYAASKVSIHTEQDRDFYCTLETFGRGPRLLPADPVPPAFAIVAGWELIVDYGSGPLPCAHLQRYDYMAAVFFDLLSIVRARWLVERAILRMRRADTAQPISLGGRLHDCTLNVMAPTTEWTRGSYIGDEGDTEANPLATPIFDRASRSFVRVRNSADPADATQQVEVTDFVNSALLHGATLFHGFLISPRASRRVDAYLFGERTLPPVSSCTGLFSQFELELSLVRATR